MARSAIQMSHNIVGERTVSDYARQDDDWYVEPSWVVDMLCRAITFEGYIHDPCCGQGTIPKRLHELKLGMPSGADIVRRTNYPVQDFFECREFEDNLIFNPPYKQAEKFILHALTLARSKVAAIVNIKFLASQGRRDRLFLPHPPSDVLILSQRPSMPPGGGLVKAGGGTADYCWIVWTNGYKGKPRIQWLS